MRFLDSDWVLTDHDTYILEKSTYAKEQIMLKIRSIEKLEMKLKMMEISFEMINDDRNSLIRQLAEAEKIIEDNETSQI